jgi:hypothetical protein
MAYDPIQLISQVGFPIAMCILIYMDLRKKIDELTKAIYKLIELKA